MQRFTYRAKDKSGKNVSGIVEAATLESAVKLLQKREFIVISIKPISKNLLYLVRKMFNRISYADVVAMTRQLATMVNAGLPITEALSILRNQANGNLQVITGRIMADVEAGEPLSVAMSKYPEVFSSTYVALVKSGEMGGVLDKVLASLADNMEKEQEFRGKVKGALIYPAIIVSGMIGVAFIMMVFVIPKLLELYQEFDAALPLPTRILIGVSNFMAAYWYVVILLAVIAIVAFNQYKNTKAGKQKIDTLYLRIPLVGELQRQVMLTDLTRTLAMMVGAGVSIIDGLNISSGVTKNFVIANALNNARNMVEKGYPISYAFAKHPEAFPYILPQMISVGEETGEMEEVLNKVSRVFEVESEQRVKVLTTAIEPAIMIVLGVGVAFLVISIILPIYNLSTQF